MDCVVIWGRKKSDTTEWLSLHAYGGSVFNFLGNLYSSLSSYHQCTRVCFSPQCSRAFVISCVLCSSHPNRWEVIIIMLLIRISLMISDVETFSCIYCPFVCPLWKKCLVKSSAHFLIALFFFQMQEFLCLFWILTIIRYVDCKYFLPSKIYLFTFLMFSFAEQMLFSRYSLTCLFLLWLLCFWCQIQKIITKTNVKKFTPYVFFQEFCSFKSYIQVFNPFWVNLCVWCEIGVRFPSFACGCPGFPTSFIKEETILSSLYILCSFVEN